MPSIEWIVRRRRWWLVKEILAIYGIEIPVSVKIGENLKIHHRGFGIVIHPLTTIGRNVQIYHQVTIGRADAWKNMAESRMEGIVIGDGAILFPGSIVLGGAGTTNVGEGTIIAANAVLLRSTGDNEIWAGVPARKIGMR